MDCPRPWACALKGALVLGWLWGLVACGGYAPRGPATAATPPAASPTLPPLVVVQRPPELEAWDEPLATCAAAGPVLLAIEPSGAADAEAWQMVWGQAPAAEGAAYAVGRDAWALVVHRSNPITRLSATAWVALWTDPTVQWADIDPAATTLPPPQPVAPLPDHALGQALTAQVGPGWVVHPRGRLAPTPADVVRAVAAHRGAFGLVPRRWWDTMPARRADLPWTQVRALPPQTFPRWEAAVVLVRATPPTRAEMRWLRCAQDSSNP